MQLERIGVALRPRTSPEAMDLGMTMLRAHARPVWLAWFAFTLPIFLLCQGLAWLLGAPWLGLLLPWWLRPLFDRIPLYVLSRAVFEQAPTWRATLRAQWAWPWKRTLAALSYLRVDTNRSLRLPMELLEGVAAKQRRARWRVLSRPLVGVASGLTWTCIAFELTISLSLCIFAVWMLPSESLPDSMRDLNQAFTMPAFKHALVWIVSGVTYVSMSIVEPLYVAAGFALYLNRRTQLEAWDIDLAFRRLRQRLLEAGVAMVLLVCIVGAPSIARAADKHADAEPVPQNIAEVFHQPVNDKDALFARKAAEVYRDPRFGQEHKVMHWVPKKPWDLNPPKPSTDPSGGWLAIFGNLGSGLLNLIFWGLLAAVVAALIVFAVRHLRGMSMPAIKPAEKPKALRSSVVHETPVPDDLPAAVRELWREGHRREALALLYRGSVQRAAVALRMQPPIDATESDWLQHARSLEDVARRERLIVIVRTWQLAAYADRYPGDADIDALLSGWPAQQVTP
jgi:hypothetical protein